MTMITREAAQSPGTSWQRKSALLWLTACTLISTAALAAPATATSNGWQDTGVIAALAREHVLRSVSDPTARVVVAVTPPDERLRLPACAAAFAETPEGQRLWGWALVRVRCPGDGGWSVSVRVRVQLMVPAVVARRAVTAGAVVEQADVQLGEVDLAASTRPTLREEAQAIGRVVRIGLAAGQAIGPEHLKLPVIVRRGAPLEVTATVGQVSVTSAGTALQDGTVGEVIRIQVPGGRTVQGVVTSEGRATVQTR